MEKFKLFRSITKVNITYDDFNLDIELTDRKLNVLYYDTPPYSYHSNDNKIIGVEGHVIDEFCSRYNFSYQLSNKQTDILTLQNMFDISLTRRFGFNRHSIYYENIELQDKGTSQCLLVPRNIPVYSHILSSPFDNFVIFLFFTSVLVTGILWKMFQILQNQSIKVFQLVTLLLKIIMGYAIDDRYFHRWSLKEQFLLIPFIAICFILMDIFKSFIISTSIVKQPMRSVQSLEELFSSDTKIYEYYKEVDLLPHDKVLNHIPVVSSSSALSKLPEHVDRNLAYMVRCKFAEVFLESENNFDGDYQLFDVFDKNIHKTTGNYLIHEGVPYKQTFISYIDSLQESGILNHWITTTVKKLFPKHVESSMQNSLALKALYLPLIILCIGLVSAILVFIIELLYYKYKEWKLSRVIDLRKERKKYKKIRRIFQIFKFSQKQSKVLVRDRRNYENN